jgi:precorrin-2 dehydrogenase/sirohydrochlorin ferrochelatase
LAYAATSDEQVHEQIARDAEAEGILLNVVDRPHLCTFIVPAVLRRGDLQIAVSTGGGSPALAGCVRDAIDASLGDEYEQALAVLSRLRTRLRESGMTPAQRQRAFKGLVGAELLDGIRTGDAATVDRLLARFAGSDMTLASLGVVLRSDLHGER